MDFWLGVTEVVVGAALMIWVWRGGVERLFAPARALVRDAYRYRMLRSMHWSDGADCPSGERLDAAIDATLTPNKEMTGCKSGRL